MVRLYRELNDKGDETFYHSLLKMKEQALATAPSASVSQPSPDGADSSDSASDFDDQAEDMDES